jgi:hypothetical protein
VMMQRAASSVLDVDVFPVAVPIKQRRWRGPEGSLLLSDVVVTPTPLDTSAAADAPTSARGMRVRLTIPPEVQSRVRMEGRRVYVDLAWPQTPWPAGSRRGFSAGSDHVRREPVAVPAAHSDEPVRAVIDRFTQVQPFLLSAVDSPEPQVLAAVAKTLEELRQSLAAVKSDREGISRLREALAMAAAATGPTFAGDRAVAAREAIGRFEAAAQP